MSGMGCRDEGCSSAGVLRSGCHEAVWVPTEPRRLGLCDGHPSRRPRVRRTGWLPGRSKLRADASTQGGLSGGRLGDPLPPGHQGTTQGDAPLVDKPVIQYAVEEAVAAGIDQVIIVTSSQKRAIEDHFDLNLELEHMLEQRGDIEMLRQIRAISDLAQISYVRQKSSWALATPVLMARISWVTNHSRDPLRRCRGG